MEIKKTRNCKSLLWKKKVTKIKWILMPPHPSTYFEIQKYYENESTCNGVYSRDNLPKIKDGAYVINLDEYSDIGTHWIGLYVLNNDITYFDSSVVEHIPKQILKIIRNRRIKTNIFIIQACYSIMCGYFCTGFIDFMLARNTLTNFRSIFSPNNFKKNDDRVLTYLMTNV